MNSAERYPSLDAIRGLAALGVVLFHYGNHFAATPHVKALSFVYQRGGIMVDVFFVMSGYLLATIYAGRRDIGTLVWRRIARLVPLHWLMLALVTLQQYAITRRYGVGMIYQNNDAYHFLLNLVLLQCVGLQNGFSFDGPAWSISVEWVVNLMLFALLASPIKRIWLPALVLALGAMFALWDQARTLLALGLYKGVLETLLLRGVVGFFTGVTLTALFPLDAPASPAPDATHTRAVGHAWDGVLVASAFGLHAYMASTTWAAWPGVDFGVGVVLIPALILGAVRGRWTKRLLALAPFQWLGRISYSLYLVHFPMQLVFVLLFPAPDKWLNYGKPSVLWSYVAATLAASWLTWRFVERPAQGVLQRVTLRRRQAAGA